MRTPGRTTVAVLMCLVLLAGCGLAGGGRCGSGATARTVWLCRPDRTPNPCTADLTATAVTAAGARIVVPAAAAGDGTAGPASAANCFYVYPTVSREPGANADLRVEPQEQQVAARQAAAFTPVCRVWAPVYRQRTLAGLTAGDDPAAWDTAYRSVLAAWRDFLASHDDGSPIVFLGHSQGSVMLIRLLHEQVDPNPGLRARTALAILPGGNLTGPAADGTPGVLPHLPACTRTGQAGCVIAYSSYSHAPPVGSIFGRPASVVCVNPAAPAGGGGALDPAFPVTAGPSGTAGRPGPRGTARPAQTPWVRYPGLYTARCRTAGGATWLQVDTPAAAADPRPRVAESDGPAWGWHAEDVNLALGNLVADVAAAVRTWQAVHR